MRKSPLSPLRNFFTEETSAVNLGIFRILAFSALILEAALHSHLAWFMSLPAVLQIGPRWFMPVPFSPAIAGAFQWLFYYFCFMAASGFKTRFHSAGAAILSLWVLGIPHMFDTPNHLCGHNHHLVWFAFLLAASPCGDSLSWDSWRKNKAIFFDGRSVDYALSIRIAWLLIGIIYFFPGFWKIRNAGLAWALSDNMRCLIHERWYELGTYHPIFPIDSFPLLYRTAGLWTLFFETSFLFLIIHPKSRKIAVLQGLLFHIGTFFTMAISFWSLLIFYPIFWDWANSDRKGPHAKRFNPASLSVGIILIAVNLYFGAAHIDDWPFTMYPGFDRLYDCRYQTVQISAFDSNGNSIPLDDSLVRKRYTPPRWLRLLQYAADISNIRVRQTYLDAIADALVKNGSNEHVSRLEFNLTQIDLASKKSSLLNRVLIGGTIRKD